MLAKFELQNFLSGVCNVQVKIIKEMMENSGAAATIVSPVYLHSDHVKNEKSNSYSFLDFLVVRQHLAITDYEISSLLTIIASYIRKLHWLIIEYW